MFTNIDIKKVRNPELTWCKPHSIPRGAQENCGKVDDLSRVSRALRGQKGPNGSHSLKGSEVNRNYSAEFR